jgi:hypothetical protein
MSDHSKEGLVAMQYDCDDLGVELTCWFEYEAAERGSREAGTGLQLEPDYPATWTLCHVYLPGSDVDIAPVLLLSLVQEIEEWVVEREEGQAEDDAWNDGYDRYVDWRDSQ